MNNQSDNELIKIFRQRKLNTKYHKYDPRTPEKADSHSTLDLFDDNQQWEKYFPNNFKHFPAFLQMMSDHFSGKVQLPNEILDALHSIFEQTKILYTLNSPQSAFDYLAVELGIKKTNIKVSRLTIFEDVLIKLEDGLSKTKAKELVSEELNVAFNTVDTKFREMLSLIDVTLLEGKEGGLKLGYSKAQVISTLESYKSLKKRYEQVSKP